MHQKCKLNLLWEYLSFPGCVFGSGKQKWTKKEKRPVSGSLHSLHLIVLLLLCCCNETVTQTKQLKERRTDLGSEFETIAHYSGEVMAAGIWSIWLHCVYSQEAVSDGRLRRVEAEGGEGDFYGWLSWIVSWEFLEDSLDSLLSSWRLLLFCCL